MIGVVSKSTPNPSFIKEGAITQSKTWMFVAMPNKRDKIELIVQKLTEIWLDEIIFWPSERSIIKQWNPKKEQRLIKIVREAVEQSRGRTLPKVRFTTNLKEELENCELIVFDKKASGHKPHASSNLTSKFWLVGPEGGLTERDYEKLEGIEYEIRELGETILRTETAAIVWGRLIKNDKF